jgi:chemotaxis protein MotB
VTLSRRQGRGQDFTRSTGQVKRGENVAPRSTINVHQLKAEQVRAEVARLEALKQKVQERIEADPKFKAMAGQVLMEMTPDGLRIQIVDAAQRPMFTSGSAIVQSYMRDLLRDLGSVLADVPNRADPGRPHRCLALQRWRTGLQQLGTERRPGQRVAP